jgi:hypothetical protein
MNFDFTSLNTKAPVRRSVGRPRNLAIRVIDFQKAEGDKATHIKGSIINPGREDDGKIVKIRMMQTHEGEAAYLALNRNANPETVKAAISKAYTAGGTLARPMIRDMMDPNSKVYAAPGGIVHFDRCTFAAKEGDVEVYKAHWLNVLASTPEIPSMIGKQAHINAYARTDNLTQTRRATAYAEVLHTDRAFPLTAETLPKLIGALANESKEGVFRRPALAVRGYPVGNPIPQFAKMIPTIYDKLKEKDPDTGNEFERQKAKPADEVVSILGGATRDYSAITNPDEAVHFKINDAILAVAIQAAKGLKDPAMLILPSDIPENASNSLRNMCKAVIDGDYVIEVIPVDRFSFGPAARDNVLKDIDSRIKTATDKAKAENKPAPAEWQVPNQYSRYTQRLTDEKGHFQGNETRYTASNFRFGLAKNGEMQVYKAVPHDISPYFSSLETVRTPATEEALTLAAKAAAEARRAAQQEANGGEPAPQQAAPAPQQAPARQETPAAQPAQEPTLTHPHEEEFSLDDMGGDFDHELDAMLRMSADSLASDYAEPKF